MKYFFPIFIFLFSCGECSFENEKAVIFEFVKALTFRDKETVAHHLDTELFNKYSESEFLLNKNQITELLILKYSIWKIHGSVKQRLVKRFTPSTVFISDIGHFGDGKKYKVEWGDGVLASTRSMTIIISGCKIIPLVPAAKNK